MTARLAIAEVSIPASVDAADAGDFLDAVDLRNRVMNAADGNPAYIFPAEEVLPTWLEQEFTPMRMFVGRIDGRAVGRSIYSQTGGTDAPEVGVRVEVDPDSRGLGIGRALTEHLTELARADGHRELHAELLVAAVDSDQWIDAPTGFGRVPLAFSGVRFAAASGFTLQQVTRESSLTLPVDRGRLESLLADAERKAGSEYDLVTWVGATPEGYLDDMAVLQSRMSTDAPTGSVQVTEQVWTAERVRSHDASIAAQGALRHLAAARHLPSDRLVAFTELNVSESGVGRVSQEATLVLKEHRGHRLGMLVKAANLLTLDKPAPRARLVITYNAEENRPMLRVNEAIGFTASGYAALFTKAL